MTIPEQVKAAAREHPYPLLFATVSGAHLYGFASADSDWDLRGAHIMPASEVVGLLPLQETIEIARNEKVELDLVTHDVRKFFTLLLRPNGYVLEQLLSPIIVQTSPEHEELKQLVPHLLTKFHAHHYIGFANNQWELFSQRSSATRQAAAVYLSCLADRHSSHDRGNSGGQSRHLERELSAAIYPRVA
jgi:predicted nucleotidyltransferase